MFAKLFGVLPVLIIGGAVIQKPVIGISGILAAVFTVYMILKMFNSLDASSRAPARSNHRRQRRRSKRR